MRPHWRFVLGPTAALGSPPIAYVEGCCVGGSTEINSGLWHRLPTYLSDEWRKTYEIEAFRQFRMRRGVFLQGRAHQLECGEPLPEIGRERPAQIAAPEHARQESSSQLAG